MARNKEIRCPLPECDFVVPITGRPDNAVRTLKGHALKQHQSVYDPTTRTLQQLTPPELEEALFRWRLQQMNSRQKKETLQARGLSSGGRGHGGAGALPTAALGRDPAGRPMEPVCGWSSGPSPVPGSSSGGGGYVEAERPPAAAGRYPTGPGLEQGEGTVDFSSAQTLDDLGPDPEVTVDFWDEVQPDLPTVRSTKDTEEVAYFLTTNLRRPTESIGQLLRGEPDPEAAWWADVVARSQRHLATRILDRVMDALQATASPAIAFDRAVRELRRYQRRPVQDDEGDDGGDGSALGPVPRLDELVSVFSRGSGVSVRLVDPADPADDPLI